MRCVVVVLYCFLGGGRGLEGGMRLVVVVAAGVDDEVGGSYLCRNGGFNGVSPRGGGGYFYTLFMWVSPMYCTYVRGWLVHVTC